MEIKEVRTNNKLPDSAVLTLSGIDVEINENFELDRYLGDTISLPYSFDEIKIKSNELVTYDNYNAAMYKLHYNFLYLNAQTKLASNDFPTRFRGYIASHRKAGVGSHVDNVRWYAPKKAGLTDPGMTSVSATIEIPASNTLRYFSSLKAGAVVTSLDRDDHYVTFVAQSARLVAVSGGDVEFPDLTIPYSADIVLDKTTVEDNTDLSFTDIVSLGINSENSLFLLDDTFLYKFNIDATLTQNKAVAAVGRFLIKGIGGLSKNIYDKERFDDPISIAISDEDDVYVLDRGSKGYKIYDKDLNWKSTAVKKLDFGTTSLSGATLTDIAVDNTNKDVYVLADNGKVLVYDKDHVLQDTYNLDDPLATNEEYKNIEFSKVDDNIVYVSTNFSIFKRFKTKIKRSIGAFRLRENCRINVLSTASTENLNFMAIAEGPRTKVSKHDHLFVGSDTFALAQHPTVPGPYNPYPYPVGKIFKFDESANYKTTIYDDYKLDLLPLSSINIKPDEYVTSWVINKSLYKMIYNHLLFKDNIHSKYTARYDDVGRLHFYGVQYIKDLHDNAFAYEPDLSNFVGVNEPVLAGVINRPIEEIYKLQSILLGTCKEDIINKYPYATQTVVLK